MTLPLPTLTAPAVSPFSVTCYNMNDSVEQPFVAILTLVGETPVRLLHARGATMGDATAQLALAGEEFFEELGNFLALTKHSLADR
jgi:hypothetical protein